VYNIHHRQNPFKSTRTCWVYLIFFVFVTTAGHSGLAVCDMKCIRSLERHALSFSHVCPCSNIQPNIIQDLKRNKWRNYRKKKQFSSLPTISTDNSSVELAVNAKSPFPWIRTQHSSVAAFIRYLGNMITEPLPSNDGKIDIQTHRLMGGIYEVRRWVELRCRHIHNQISWILVQAFTSR
jgi:hypothetical protein